MGFENKYPYTDFHEMNLDWILEVVKGIETEWPEFKTTMETEWNTYKDGLTGEGGEWPTFKAQVETIVNNFIHDVVGNYNSNLDYQSGMFCYYEGNVYKCTTGSTAAFPRPFSAYNWFSYSGQNTNSIVNDLFNYLTTSLNNQDIEIFQWIQNTAAQWDETKPYVAGDYCSAYVGGYMTPSSWRYYKCLQDCTDVNVFDTNYWKEVIFASDVTETIAAYKQAMQDQYDQFLEDYQRTFGVVQTRGSSTTDVMSQKAVSDELQAHDDMIDNLIKDIAPVYDSTKAYKIGNLLSASGKMYLTIKDAPAGTPVTNTEYFEEKSVADIIEMIKTGAITVGKANLANNFDSKMVLTDNSGYLYRTTGGALEVGEQNRVKKIVGASVPIIQHIFVNQNSQSKTESGVTITDNRDGTYTVSTDANGATADVYLAIGNFMCTAGHLYYWSNTPKGGSNSTYYGYISGLNGNDYGNGNFYVAYESKAVYPVPVFVKSGTVITTPIMFKPQCFDLTQSFGTTVANRLYALEQAQAGTGIAKAKEILVKDYYPYNVTAFTHTKTSGKVNNGFNQWDGVWENGDIDADTGANVTSTTRYRSTNYIEVFPNTAYYIASPSILNQINIRARFYDANKNYIGYEPKIGNANTNTTFTTPDNACFMRFSPTTTNIPSHQICINLHWDGERDGEYEPYQEWNYPVEDVELKGILSLDAQDNWVADGDEYLPSGEIDVKYFLYDFNEIPTNKVSKWGGTNWVITVKYISQVLRRVNVPSIVSNIQITGGNYPNLLQIITSESYADATEFLSAMANCKIFAKLLNEETDSADPYTELQNDSNWGTEKWIDTRDVPLPVFSTCEYIPDLKAKVETAPESPDEDGDYIMHRENGLNSYGSLSTWLSANGYNKMQDLLTFFNKSIGGTLRQSLCIKNEGLSFNSTSSKDMGDLNWVYQSEDGGFLAQVDDKVDDTEGQIILSTAFEVDASSVSTMANNTIKCTYGTTRKDVFVKTNSTTDASAFKSSVKGQLIAYKKVTT